MASKSFRRPAGQLNNKLDGLASGVPYHFFGPIIAQLGHIQSIDETTGRSRRAKWGKIHPFGALGADYGMVLAWQ
jgi:hypothetical protein